MLEKKELERLIKFDAKLRTLTDEQLDQVEKLMGKLIADKDKKNKKTPLR